MSNPLVSVDERMSLDQIEAERSGLVDKLWIQLGTIKRDQRLGQGGLDASQVPHARRAAGDCDEVGMQSQDLRQREKPHLASRW